MTQAAPFSAPDDAGYILIDGSNPSLPGSGGISAGTGISITTESGGLMVTNTAPAVQTQVASYVQVTVDNQVQTPSALITTYECDSSATDVALQLNVTNLVAGSIIKVIRLGTNPVTITATNPTPTSFNAIANNTTWTLSADQDYIGLTYTGVNNGLLVFGG